MRGSKSPQGDRRRYKPSEMQEAHPSRLARGCEPLRGLNMAGPMKDQRSSVRLTLPSRTGASSASDDAPVALKGAGYLKLPTGVSTACRKVR